MRLASHAIILCFSVTLISHFIKWLTICPVNSYTFYPIAFVASLGASPFVLFIPFLSHCFLCFTVCLTICTDTLYLFYHTAFIASLSASSFVLFIPFLFQCFICFTVCLTTVLPHCFLCFTVCLTICTVYTRSITWLSLFYCVPHHLY